MRSIGAFGLLMVMGCQEFGLRGITDAPPTDEPVAVVEQFVHTATAATDVLFVVDDTGSMGQEQQALAAAMPELLSALDDAGVSWQLGVVRMSFDDHSGWLLGVPYILTPSVEDVDALAAERVRVGTTGPGPETGLAMAVETVSDPGAVNRGFLRPGATLHVVFVSDSDDQSDERLDEPVADALSTLRSAVPQLRVSAVVGDVPGGCVSANGSATPGTRYVQAAEQAGGVVGSICAVDFDALAVSMAEASVVYQSVFTLRNTPVASSVRVWADDEPVGAFVVTDREVVIEESLRPGAGVEIRYLVAP